MQRQLSRFHRAFRTEGAALRFCLLKFPESPAIPTTMKRFLLAAGSVGFYSILCLPCASSAQVVPVRIRMIAAHYSYYKNPDPNGGKLVSSSAGYDVAWNMRRFDYSLYTSATTQKLDCRGSMTYTPADGSPACSGTFTFNPDGNPVLYPAPVQTGDIITLQISGPVDSSGRLAADALVGDRTPGLPYVCQVPNGGYLIGGAETETWSPKVAEAQFRRGYANVQFNIKSLPQVLPFKWIYNGSRDDGTVSKIVFFGRVEVTEDAPTVPLTPVDALTLGGYSPPAAGHPPADPPDRLTPPDATDFSKWFKDIFPPLSGSIKAAIVKLHPAPAPSNGPAPAAATKAIVAKIPKAAPFAGSVKIAVVVKPAGTTATPSFPKNFTQNTITVGSKSLKVVLNSATLKAIKSNRAHTVFILTKATPKGGKSVVLSKRISLKAFNQ